MKFIETIPLKDIARFWRRWQIRKFALFGSATRDDFRPESDIDVLVTFNPTAEWGLFEHPQMQNGLHTLLGRKVDLVTRRAVEQTQNQILRDRILKTAQVIFSQDETAYAERWGYSAGHDQRGASGAGFYSRVDKESFVYDLKTCSAVLYQITVIGEVVKRLSKEFRAKHREIPWALIAGMRDNLTHGYDLVDWDEVWKTSKVDVPELLDKIESYLWRVLRESRSRP